MNWKYILAAMALALSCAATTAQTDSIFYIKGPMGQLAARLQVPPLKAGEQCHMVILCHGFTSEMNNALLENIAENLTKAGIGVFRFDFNAHGKSEGNFADMTVLNEMDDLISAISFMRNLEQTASISLLGHSQGGVVASMVAGQLGRDAIKSLVLMAPAAVLRDDALRGNTMGATYDPWHAPEYVELPSGHKLGRNFIQTAISLPIYETAAHYDGPALVIHGMADRVVPYTYGERFNQVLPACRLNLIPGEDHAFSSNMPYAVSLASGWLIKTLDE